MGRVCTGSSQPSLLQLQLQQWLHPQEQEVLFPADAVAVQVPDVDAHSLTIRPYRVIIPFGNSDPLIVLSIPQVQLFLHPHAIFNILISAMHDC